MKITTFKVKQYGTTSKIVICLDNMPFIIARSSTQADKIIGYMNGATNVELTDGAIKAKIDKLHKGDS